MPVRRPCTIVARAVHVVDRGPRRPIAGVVGRRSRSQPVADEAVLVGLGTA